MVVKYVVCLKREIREYKQKFKLLFWLNLKITYIIVLNPLNHSLKILQ